MASIPTAATIYREDQLFAWWWYALLGLWISLAVVILSGFSNRLPLGNELPSVHGLATPLWGVFGIVAPSLVWLCWLRMTTVMTPTDVRVWFGWLPSYRRQIALGSIQSAESVSFRPLTDHLGWGLRHGVGGELVLTARGDKGVLLHMIDGSKILVGSQRPDEFADAIVQAIAQR